MNQANESSSPNSDPNSQPRKKIAIGSQRDVADVSLSPARPAVVERAERQRLGTPETAGSTRVVPEEAPAVEATPAAAGAQPAEVKLSAAQPADGRPEVAQPGAAQPGAAVANAAATAAAAVTSAPVPQDSGVRSRIGLGDDLDAEIEMALSGVSMEELVDKAAPAPVEPEAGERLKATVTRVDPENVLVSLKGRYEGIMQLKQFRKPPVIGDLVEVLVRSRNEEDGLFEVGLPGAAADSGDWDTLNKGDVVEARITGANTGGLEAIVGSLRGFIPASQIERFRVEQLGDYVNQKFPCVVTEINPGRKKLVLSRRAILEREFEETRRQLMASLQPGTEMEGIITRLADFGAFVDIGGVEGLIHISKLSWSRIKHPKEAVQVGQRIKVKVEKVEPEAGRISLSHRDTIEHPWEGIETRFPVGSVVKGKVTRLAEFGAFVRLDHGIEGLIHISELAHHRVLMVKNIVKESDEVEVKILSVDRNSQKIGLSLKATQAAPEKPAEKQKAEEEFAPRELAVKGSGQPLSGGKTRKSGGEQFGLRL